MTDFSHLSDDQQAVIKREELIRRCIDEVWDSKQDKKASIRKDGRFKSTKFRRHHERNNQSNSKIEEEC